MTAVGPQVARSAVRPSIETIEVTALDRWAAAWDRLAATAPQPSPFVLSWWLEAQAAAEVGARFVLVLEADELLGGMAVQVDHRLGVRRVRLLGAGPLAPDHLDVVAHPGRRPDVVGAVAAWLAERPTFADLRGIAGQAMVLDALPARRRLVTELSAAPYLVLPGNGDEPVEPIRRARDLRQQSRRLDRAGARYRCVGGADPADLDRALADLRSLHVQLWGDRSGLSRRYAAFAAAARAGAPTGAVRIHQLVADREVVATEVTLDAAGRRFRYQVGRTLDHQWRGSGNALLLHVIRGAATDGCMELDFLRGRESYKYDWTVEERPILRARAAQGRRAVLALHGLAATERARPAARAVKAWVRARLARRRGRRA